MFVDESHVAVPQIGGMYRGDRARKEVLVEHGFRLPSALDNRPLRFEEWEKLVRQLVYVSATPSKYELEHSRGAIAEQIVRPTGLLDPAIEVRPAATQVDDLLAEIRRTVKSGWRVLARPDQAFGRVTTYYAELSVKVRYLHSEDRRHRACHHPGDLRGVRRPDRHQLLREFDLPSRAEAVLDATRRVSCARRPVDQTCAAPRNGRARVVLRRP